jgi:hypothetical protein
MIASEASVRLPPGKVVFNQRRIRPRNVAQIRRQAVNEYEGFGDER